MLDGKGASVSPDSPSQSTYQPTQNSRSAQAARATAPQEMLEDLDDDIPF